MRVIITIYQLDKTNNGIMDIITNTIDKFNDWNDKIYKSFHLDDESEFSQEYEWDGVGFYDCIKIIRLYKNIKKKIYKYDDSIAIFLTLR